MQSVSSLSEMSFKIRVDVIIEDSKHSMIVCFTRS